MRGVRLASFGEGDPHSRLEVRDDLLVPPLNPSTNDVLVRVEATSVNPIDLAMRKGYARKILFRARAKESPMTLGFDCVGTVVQTGKSAWSFKVGDRVWGSTSLFRDGCNAEYVLVEEPALAQAPANLTSVKAAALPTAAVAAWKALVESGQLGPVGSPSPLNPSATTDRQRVFINGDSDGVGVIALQLLKHYGHHASAVCSAPNVPKFTQLIDAGGGEVIDHTREPDWAARLAGEGKEYDVLLDTVGTDEAEAQCVKLLKRGGKYLSLRPLVLDLIHEHGPFMGAMKGWWSIVKKQVEMKKEKDVLVNYVTCGPDGKVLEQVRRLVEEGVIRPDVDRVFDDLAQLPEAHALLERGEARGKVVIKVQDPLTAAAAAH